jgi:hypothetical protein
MKKLVDFEFFEEGDHKDKGRWTEADFKKAHDYLESIDKESGIAIILNPKEAHDTKDSKNVAVLGRIKEIYRKPNGVWSGNGVFLEELAYLLEKKMYTGKSVGLIRTSKGEVKIDHIALCGAQRAHLDKLKPNNLSIFDTERLGKLKHVQLFSSQSEGDDNVEIDYSQSVGENDGSDSSANPEKKDGNQSVDSGKPKIKEKETKKMSEFTEADVKLKIRDALDTQKKEFQRDTDDIKRDFTLQLEAKGTEIEKKDKEIAAKKNEISIFKETIETKDSEIAELTKTITAKDTEIEGLKAEFVKQKEDLIKREVGYFVHNCSAIPPVEKKAKYQMLFTIRQQSKDAYDNMKKIISGSGNPMTFGADSNFTTGSSDYDKVVKEFTDNSGNVGLEIDMAELSDQALKALEQ